MLAILLAVCGIGINSSGIECHTLREWWGIRVGHCTEQRASNEQKADDLVWHRWFTPLAAVAIGIAVEAVFIHRMSEHGDFFRKGEAWKFALFGMAAGSAYWFAAAFFNSLKIAGQQKTCVFG